MMERKRAGKKSPSISSFEPASVMNGVVGVWIHYVEGVGGRLERPNATKSEW